ncbi:3-oxoacyl-ACP reductase [Polaromonas sp. CG_9.11]|uniref:3-oxoacyl-ACP reductase n=1 Tax=Polaromonas sp. CG_9.11 TaxID=2787730 RepID=UPI0018C952AA|nr:3-oxoacyl-ACP reductase [Polaromonas sp. CG_9.11]MBG6074251.1 3-oxoacyl-[acyl-carrier protein] reductase [Polaromonas sp. CG_9.11]
MSTAAHGASALKFQGQVVLVTGASRGIGAAIALAFAREGALVVVNYLRNEAAANAVVARCQEVGGDGLAIQADVCSEAAVQAMVVQVLDEVGRIDVVVNNAFKGFTFDPDQRKMFWELAWSDYEAQVDGAVHAAYNVCQAVLPHFRQRARGSIINMVSDLIERPSIPYHDYTTAKSALVGFSRNLAVELGPLGIRVNCVAPGLVYPTSASQGTPEEVRAMIVGQTPLRRVATPDDVAGPVLFLASDWSRFMTGQVLFVDGGLVMK